MCAQIAFCQQTKNDSFVAIPIQKYTDEINARRNIILLVFIQFLSCSVSHILLTISSYQSYSFGHRWAPRRSVHEGPAAASTGHELRPQTAKADRGAHERVGASATAPEGAKTWMILTYIFITSTSSPLLPNSHSSSTSPASSTPPAATATISTTTNTSLSPLSPPTSPPLPSPPPSFPSPHCS